MTMYSESVVAPGQDDAGTYNKFQQDVLEGLRRQPKNLHSKYFYDETGDTLFQEIMAMPEYYLTDCEMDIFMNQSGALSRAFIEGGEPFDLIELGAGDASKSCHLLNRLMAEGAHFTYMPIDISGHILQVLETNLKQQMPELAIVPLEGEYFDMLDEAGRRSSRRKVVLFLGANIGNMLPAEAEDFCAALRSRLRPTDQVLIGFDLKKHPQTILNAYNDPAGITSRFNLNLLTRINRELDADFVLDRFHHYQTYDPATGACKSYLISLEEQQVRIGGETIRFERNEAIFMEVSNKFAESDIAELAKVTGFTPTHTFSDAREWFVDVIWRVD